MDDATVTEMPTELRAALDLTFTDRSAAEAWLDRPSPYLHGSTPRDAIEAGREDRVLAALEAIHAGFAS